MKRVPAIGEVFQVPVDDRRLAYGQVLGFAGGTPFVALFKRLYEKGSVAKIAEVVADEIALLTAVTSDALSGEEWAVLGQCDLAPARFAPAFRQGIGTTGFPYKAVSLDGLPHPSISPEQAGQIDYLTIHSTATVEEAIRVFHGLGEPSPIYPGLLASTVQRDAERAGTAAMRFRPEDLVVPKPRPPEQAVVVQVPLDASGFGSPMDQSRMREIADEVHDALKRTRSGDFDGDELGQGRYTLYLYGPQADRILVTVLPVLRRLGLPATTLITARYGEVDDPSARVEKMTLETRADTPPAGLSAGE